MVELWKIFKRRKFALQKSEKKEFINKKNTYNINIFKFWKDFENFEILNLLVNFMKGATFSWLIKC